MLNEAPRPTEPDVSDLYIAQAGRKGRGVFTSRGLPPDTPVVVLEGKEDWVWNIPREEWDHALQVDYDRYVVPVTGSPGWFLNHSCEPNCVLVGRLEVKTWRRVRAGEELTIDYSTNVGWDGFKMDCFCGADSCRGLVRSYSFLPPVEKKKYGENVSPFLLGRGR